MYTLTQALQALTQHSNNNTITAAQITALLANTSVTFANIQYVTKVQTAAAHKTEQIQKITSANVILCSSLKSHTSVYANKVKKTAAAIASNDMQAVQAFTAQKNYFEHTATHCIVQHTQHADKQYLYVIYNNAQSIYVHNGKQATLQQVAQYLTPSAARDLQSTDRTVHNVTHNIAHTVAVRTIALSNIVSIKARKQLLAV